MDAACGARSLHFENMGRINYEKYGAKCVTHKCCWQEPSIRFLKNSR